MYPVHLCYLIKIGSIKSDVWCRKMRFILADDNAQVCSALKLLLQTRTKNSEIIEVDNTGDLIAKVRLTHPDLVFLDWELPDLESESTVQTLRSLDPNLIIIALSGQPEAQIVALNAGVDGFINKGYPPEQILRTLQISR